jgi:hypothetical protein
MKRLDKIMDVKRIDCFNPKRYMFKNGSISRNVKRRKYRPAEFQLRPLVLKIRGFFFSRLFSQFKK